MRRKLCINRSNINTSLISRFGMLIILNSALLLSGCSAKGKEYSAEVAKYENIAEEIDVTGDIKGENSTTYYASVSSPILNCNLKVGDTVLSNEILLTYDTIELERALEQALITAESTKNNMNGQITSSNKNASLYNKAVDDSNVYMGLYAIARANNDQINQSQYQENWDIANSSKSIEGQIAEKSKTIANKTSEANEKTESLLKLTPGTEEYKKVTDELSDIKNEITDLNKDIASLNGSLAALPQAMLNPEENAKETVNNNWMQDISRNWSESTTVKNTYEGQILNSYQKDQLQNAYDLAEVSVEYATEDIKIAQEGVAANFNGVVTECSVSSGTVVSKGMPLFTIESGDDLKVSVGISKYDIGKVALGQRAKVEVAGHIYDGVVSDIKRLAQMTDSDKAKVDVSIHINNPDEYAYLGLEADVTIYANEKDNALIIPIEGYYVDDSGEYCYLIRDEKIEKQYIKTGIESADYIEVTAGINPGDIVVTDAITDDAIGGRAFAK